MNIDVEVGQDSTLAPTQQRALPMNTSYNFSGNKIVSATLYYLNIANATRTKITNLQFEDKGITGRNSGYKLTFDGLLLNGIKTTFTVSDIAGFSLIRDGMNYNNLTITVS